MSPLVVEAFDFVPFLHFYKDEKHMHLATISSVLIKCLTWKENLEGDGQRFHEKKQTTTSHIKSLSMKKVMKYGHMTF
jgi:hypothetical protein